MDPLLDASLADLRPADDGVSRRSFLAIVSGGVAALSGASLAGCGPRAEPVAERPSDLTWATAAQLAELIRRKQVSSLEAVDACILRIEAVQPEINAVVQLTADRAREAARSADQALARGGSPGPLHGVPMTIKDSLDTVGIVTTGGTRGRRDFVPSEDATVVARLKAAGAILLGKTNTPELTLSYETDNPIYGRTNNPWDPTRSPGGSSGGAGAIVATGGAAFDIGSDTGGSIRVPSHFCGVAGIKPTSGRVPRTGHIIPAEGHLQSWTQLGPLARSVDDLALILGVIAGPDGRDAAIAPVPLGDHRGIDLPTLRVAVHTDNGIRAPAAEIAKAVTDAAGALASAGAAIEERRPDGLAEGFSLAIELYSADGGAWVKRLLAKAGTTEPGPSLAGLMGQLRAVPSADLTAAIERWDVWRGMMLRFLDRYDAILCPPCALIAPPHGGASSGDTFPAFSYTFCYNMTGWPAAVVRAGTSPEGFPIGVQIVGRPWREDVVLALSAAIERGLGGFQAPVI
jgi:amidase